MYVAAFAGNPTPVDYSIQEVVVSGILADTVSALWSHKLHIHGQITGHHSVAPQPWITAPDFPILQS